MIKITKIVFFNKESLEGEFDQNNSGFGSYLYKNGDSYTGDFYNGKKHGKGTFRYNNKDEYQGDYLNDTKHGKGKYSSYSEN